MLDINNIQELISSNSEYAWSLVFILAFIESLVIAGSFLPSIVLFSYCVFLYHTGILPLEVITPIAILGAHLGDVISFYIGKKVGPSFFHLKFIKKREKLVNKIKNKVTKYGPLTIILGRFIPPMRPIVPCIVGISDAKFLRFYICDLIACLLWGGGLIGLTLLTSSAV